MFQKAWLVGGIVIATVTIILLVTVMQPFFQDMSEVIANDTTTGNYWGYKAAGQSIPIWIYGIVILVGSVGVITVLRKKN